jgi:hypothetical protein
MTIGLQSLINACYAYAPAGWPQDRLALIVKEMQDNGVDETDMALAITRYLARGLRGEWI